MLTRELVEYIHKNYSSFLTEEERKLYDKLHDYSNWLYNVKEHGVEIMKDKLGLFNLNINEINFLASIDRKQLDWTVATRIWNMHESVIFINKCPICGEIARTKQARQCRKGHRW